MNSEVGAGLPLLTRFGWFIWLLLLVTVPVTSFPLVAKLSGGETPVSPLALLPLAVLLFTSIIPSLVRGRTLPRILWPLLLFALVTLISAAASVALNLIPFKAQTYLDRLLRGFLTLGIGLSFYLAAIVLPNNGREMRRSFQALYFGLTLMLIWSSVQAWLVLDGSERVPLIITRIHHIFSVRDPLGDRVTGMAYEPSWLGDQLVILYIPLLLASVLRGFTVYKIKWCGMTVELLLLLWSLFILLLTLSRISFLSLLLIASAAFFYIGSKILLKLTSKRARGVGQVLLRIIGLIIIAMVWGLVVYGVLLVLREFDDRMTFLLSAPKRLEEFAYFYPGEAGFALADRLAFAERIAYWTVGLRTFSQYPVLGVGPGNVGFFFDRFLPPYAVQLNEITDVLTLAEFGFPNAKNLWIRLLAEGGLVGFGSYFVWFLLIALGSVALWRHKTGLFATLGLAGSLGAITFFVEAFSLDSYALPQTWILFGLVTAGLQTANLDNMESIDDEDRLSLETPETKDQSDV
jgi:O-antigen ligase